MNDITERRQRLEECLDRAFKTPVVKEKKNPLYTLSLFFVTLVMVLLPILYLGIIAGAVYGVYWHIVTNYTIFDGRVSRGRIFVFIAPIIVGGILIFFLFKPLLVRQRAKWNRILLDKEKEPFLFRVVYKMCDYLGAKRPDKLYIDNEVNAYASHRVGLTGILFNKIDLGIGMPFIEGLSFNQLMGVLAHEFGHFRQGFACRLTGISMAVNHWLYRVVYERDHWDETLDEHLKDENSSGWVMSIGYIVKLFIWISRRVLWLLMLLGHLVSHFALRQLEYDADRSEAFLVGTQTMEDTFYRARELSLASQSATENIFRQLHEGRAPEDYTGVINYFAGKFNDKDSAANRKAVLEETAGFFSTHPAPAKRIAKAKETGFNGILNKEFSNNILLTNQETIRKDLTRQMYQHWKVDKAVLDSPLDMNAFIALQRKQELADNAFTEIFETYISRHNLLFYSPDVAEEELIGSPEETVRAVRAQLKEKAEECEKNFKAINKEIKLLDKTNLALLLLDLDVKVPTEAWGLGNDEEQLKKDKVEIEQRLLALNGSFDFINARGNVRFHALKGYWQSRDGDSAGNVENWLNALASLKTAAPEFLFLNREIVLYHFLVENLYESLRDNGHFIHILRKTGAGLIKSLKVIGEKLKEVKYPFEHQKGAISMADYLVDAALPHEQDIERVFNLVNSANSNFLSLYYELLSKLAVKIAEVE